MTIATNVKKIKAEIQQALQLSGRKQPSVKLVVVTKGRSIESIKQVIAAGQSDLAENYLQEALPKIAALHSYPLQWHFIGPVQTKKTRQVAEHFSWVHTVACQKIAERLNAQRPEHLPPLNVCVQVNISREAKKFGLDPNEASDFLIVFKGLARLRLRGLMVIPAATVDYQQQRQVYSEVAAMFAQLQQQVQGLDTLSMGMSDDFLAAIAAGSTLVRIGRAIFREEAR